ncbi:MAG: CotH kinase family protein [Bacteroidales bacterium]|nr:CotH kinase family protein [Bacteroidales bacterium]
MAGIGIRRTVRVCLAAIAMSGMAACRLSIDDVPAEEPMVSRPVFTDFSLGNYSGTKKSLSTEIGDGNVVVIYPYGENVDILKATFATDAVEVTVNGINQVSGTTSNDFSRPVRYRLVSEDGIVSEYIVSVRFASDVPVIYITTPGKAAINSKVDWIAGGEIDICNLDGKVDSLGAVSVRGRGNSTWSYPKKSYNIKLDSRQEVLGMNRHKRWCLLANWMDRTMLRNAVAFEIAKRTKGLAWTPDGQFVDLVLNGKHCGAYYLCEHIRIDKNRVDIAEMTSADISGDNVTGGYLMELDSYYDEINKFRSRYRGLPVMFKNPDEEVLVKPQFEYMQNYFNQIEAYLFGGYVPDTRYMDYIDVDSFIDWWFVNELSGNREPQHPKSAFMHKDRSGKLVAGPVWDFDWETFVPSDNAFLDSKSIWYEALFRDPAFVKRVKEKWIESRAGFKGIPEYIDSMAEKYGESATKNGDLWKISIVVNRDESMSWKESVERMKSAYTSRFNYLDIAIPVL